MKGLLPSTELYISICLAVKTYPDLSRFSSAVLAKTHGPREWSGSWTKYETSMTIESQTKENIAASMDKPYSLTYVGSATANIFGHTLTYPFMRTLLSVKLEKPEKVIRLLELLDEGDDIPMVFIPGNDTVSGEYIDRLGDTTTDNPANEVI